MDNIVPNGPMGELIKNEQFVKYIVKNMNYCYNNKTNNFPGANPVSIEKKDFEKFEKHVYHVSLKTNGTRFIMYFLKDKNDINKCILINRALECFVINNIEADDNIYNGTILDGELCFDNDLWKFIVHDGVLLCGNRINKAPYSSRMFDINSCINTYIYTTTNDIEINIKKYYNYTDFKEFIDNEYVPNKINNDGIIFMPETLPVISGTQYSMLKWKSTENCTFDFLIKENNDDMEAYVFHMGKSTIFAKIDNTKDEGKDFIEKAKKLPEYKNECILECSFKNNNFVPLLIRTDKTHSNSLRTIERTLFNITEGITINDFK